MNCQHFDELVVDLVREPGLEGPVRSEALEHAASCERCSARLEGQQALSAAFKLARTEGGEAPAFVEFALMASYRARQAQTMREFAPGRPTGHISYAYWGIAAALLVALLGVATFRLLQTPRSSPIAGHAPGVAAPVAPPAAKLEPAPAVAAPKVLPLAIAIRQEAATKKNPPRQSAARAQAAESEIATDFFPLASRTEIAAMESGQIVRVLLPRNAMAAYGLPVNQERMDEPVAAQVLIGQDGVARAIRFLGSQNTNFVQTGMRSKR